MDTSKVKYVCLLAVMTLLMFGCSKEEVHGPWELKNGQVVEVQVSHRYGAVDDEVTLLSTNKPGDMSLYGFSARKPGYNYRVKAKMVVPDQPMADGPSYYLEFIEVLAEEKYEGTESFEIELIQAVIPSGPMIVLMKEENQYWFGEKIQLTTNDELVSSQLQEIWEHREIIRENHENDAMMFTPLKWRSVRATVTHDPDNFGKAYLVSNIEFAE